MKPLLASICVGLGIFVMCRLDRDKSARISKALWIPLAWLLIGSSRPVTEWLQTGIVQGSSYEEGSPLDRTILIILIMLGLFIISKRGSQVKAILRLNWPIIIFFIYCLISMVWSDFPFVTLKRWFRAVGDVVMILVVITDPYWEVGLKWTLRRIAFLLIPLSVLIIKFFPEYGRSYTATGAQMWTGVCTDKNGLGAVCMVFGTALLWQFLPVSSGPESKTVWSRERLAQASVLAMTLYLVWVIDSKTALMCFLLANTLIFITWLGPRFRRPAFLTTVVAGMIFGCFCVLFLGVDSGALQAIGRRSDLTGRTEIWATVLPLVKNPVLGTGYEDFWMGDRIEYVARNLALLNQAHNGYLEIYLNLGWVGLILLGAIIVTGYRNIIATFRSNIDTARLKIVFFMMCLIYNFTEATFKMQSPVWICFLWAAMAVPISRRSRGSTNQGDGTTTVVTNETVSSWHSVLTTQSASMF